MALQEQTDICRICLRSDVLNEKKGMSLFQNYKDSLISEQINSIANVDIKQNDGLPDKICPECLIELESAINFKQKCITSNAILHNKGPDNLENLGVKLEFNIDDIKEEKLEELCIESEIIEETFYDDIETEVTKPEKPSRAIDLKLICHDCGGSFPSKCKLGVHWKKVHLPEALICQTCKRTFKSYKAYHKHIKSNRKSCHAMKNVQINGIGKSRLYVCKECPYTSRRNKDMQTHLLTHNGERPVKCLSCDQQFTQLSSMYGHMERVHRVYKVEITCQYCGKLVRGRQAVYLHLQGHKTAGSQCDICKKVFSCKKSVRTHMVRHTGVKTYTCEKCAKTFYTLAELCNHKRFRHNKTDVWYKCELCDYKSQRAHTTKRHQAKHTAPNMVACHICGKFFENAEKLALHEPRHSDDQKKFECPHCDKRFYKKDSIRKHIKDKHNSTADSLLCVNKSVAIKSEVSVLDETINGTQLQQDNTNSR